MQSRTPVYCIERICLNCPNRFFTSKREVKRNNGKFCSISCSSKYQRKQTPKPLPNVFCSYCNKNFYKPENKQKNSKSGLFFCCREHKDLAQCIGGIEEIMPSHYGTGKIKHGYRKKAFSHYLHCCNSCGYKKYKSVLVVHHKDRDRNNDSLENLEILCPTCHEEEHFLAKDGRFHNVK